MGLQAIDGDSEMSFTGQYVTFLRKVTATKKLWAIWCGDTWATANDPSVEGRALFMLWPMRKSAESALKANKVKFPEVSEVNEIDLDKWVDAYTPQLISEKAFAFLVSDEKLNGLTVDPSDLRRDIKGMASEFVLQSSGLARLHRKVKKRLDG